MASMESMAMVAAVQCDGNGSICFSSAAKAHVACTVPRITNHATTFGIAHNCSLWSHDCHRSASWPTTAVCRGQRTCAHAAWQIFCCMNHIKLARDQLAKRGGIRICWRGVRSKRYRAHCPLVFGVCRQRRPKQWIGAVADHAAAAAVIRRCSAPGRRLGTVADLAAAAAATAGERVDCVRVFSGSPAAATAGPPGQALGYAAPSCRLNALWFGILSLIRTSSRNITSSSNRASHSTATQWSDGFAQHNCAKARWAQCQGWLYCWASAGSHGSVQSNCVSAPLRCSPCKFWIVGRAQGLRFVPPPGAAVATIYLASVVSGVVAAAVLLLKATAPRTRQQRKPWLHRQRIDQPDAACIENLLHSSRVLFSSTLASASLLAWVSHKY